MPGTALAQAQPQKSSSTLQAQIRFLAEHLLERQALFVLSRGFAVPLVFTSRIEGMHVEWGELVAVRLGRIFPQRTQSRAKLLALTRRVRGPGHEGV